MGIDPALVNDITMGTVLTPDATYFARAAALAAGFPESVPVQCVNRFCSSGLMAVTGVANQIRAGQIEIGLALGVESMSEKYAALVLCVRQKFICTCRLLLIVPIMVDLNSR
jgi:acetyl-CoA acetyltransferase